MAGRQGGLNIDAFKNISDAVAEIPRVELLNEPDYAIDTTYVSLSEARPMIDRVGVDVVPVVGQHLYDITALNLVARDITSSVQTESSRPASFRWGTPARLALPRFTIAETVGDLRLDRAQLFLFGQLALFGPEAHVIENRQWHVFRYLDLVVWPDREIAEEVVNVRKRKGDELTIVDKNTKHHLSRSQ